MAGESIRDRLSSLTRGELLALVLVVVVSLGGVGLWYTRSLPKPVQVQAAPGPVASAGAGSPSPSPSPVSVFVHVAGWVRKPGVYELAEGQRVMDAIEAAGGAKNGADLDALNLAAPLVDGTQILVPRAASSVPPGSAGVVPPGAPGTGPGGLVNINTASETELETLPGIGPVTAQAIIDYRTENGPFGSVDELEDVSGIGPATLAEIADLVTI